MVYRGKPSTACEPCRIRRLKCDRVRPFCTQCRNTSRVCAYRNTLDLLFQHENNTVIQKYASKENTPEPKFSTKPQWPVDCGQSLSSNSQFLTHAPEKSAINFFLLAYVEGMYLDYVPALYRAGSCPLSLVATLEAVALACLANEKCQPGLLSLARRKYGIALRATNEALQSVATAITDETLASVMLLAYFGAVSSDPSEARDSWSKHVNGALAIAALRPRELGQSAAGQALLDHVVSSVQVECISQRKAAPALLTTLYENFPGLTSAQSHFRALIERVLVLQTAIKKRSKTTNSLETVLELRSLDETALKLMGHMSLSHPHAAISFEKKKGDPNNRLRYYSSPSHRITQSWNSMRMLRMYINHTIYSLATQSLDSQATIPFQATILQAQMDEAAQAAVEMAMGICGSVPEFLQPTHLSGMDDSGGDGHTAWAHSLIWPLSSAVASPLLPEDLRQQLHSQQRCLETATNLRCIRQSASSSSFCTAIKEW
ncbi:hypothetical protein Egran_03714 [Elaphomyces granulatus]|uniref:Zn(2)-C6 fungal-type domain-containing protein n=1 Tax=Elaphomyces granulatus TaxID=519963 RepID=A0A232LWW6_9EURO|nr:hypothetical protein Egran_03714 [Elaphomyces granulatus]